VPISSTTYLYSYSWSFTDKGIEIGFKNSISLGCLSVTGLAYSPDDDAIYGISKCGSGYNVSLFVYSLGGDDWITYAPVDSQSWGTCSMDLQSVVYSNVYYYFTCGYMVLFGKDGNIQKQMRYYGPNLAGFPVEDAAIIQNSFIGMTLFHSNPEAVHYVSRVDPNTGFVSQMNVDNYAPVNYKPYGSTADGKGSKWFLKVYDRLLVVDVSNLEKPALISNFSVATYIDRVKYLSP